MKDTGHPFCDGKGCYKCDPPLSDVKCPECKEGFLTKENPIEYGDLVNCSKCHQIFKVTDDEKTI